MRPIALGRLSTGLEVAYTISVKQAKHAVEPLFTPSLPAESPAVSGTHHVTPDLLFYPVFDKRKTSTRMPYRKVVHPTAQDRIYQLDHPPYRLALESSEGVSQLRQQRCPILHLRRILGPPRALFTPREAELKAEKVKTLSFPQIHDSTLLFIYLHTEFLKLFP